MARAGSMLERSRSMDRLDLEESERDCLGFHRSTWASWVLTFAMEFLMVALIFPLVLKLMLSAIGRPCMRALCPQVSAKVESASVTVATEYLLVETIKRVPQGLIAYSLLFIRRDESAYEWMAAHDPTSMKDPAFAQINHAVVLSEAYYPFLAFLFVALLRAHDEASFKRDESARQIMQHGSMRRWLGCLNCIQNNTDTNKSFGRYVNNKVDTLRQELSDLNGFRIPDSQPEERRFAELHHTFIEGYHFEISCEIGSVGTVEPQEAEPARRFTGEPPERWKKHALSIQNDPVVKRIEKLRNKFRRTSGALQAKDESGYDPWDLETGTPVDKPYLPANFVAQMIVELSLKDGRLHRNQGWWVVSMSSLLHAAIPLIWRVSIGRTSLSHCYIGFWDWVNPWTLTGCLHLLSFVVNYTVTFSIAIRMFKCYEDFYVRYRRMLYLLHLCPWSTMKETRRVDSFGMLPTFHLNSITNIEAWNKTRIFLQRYDNDRTRRIQTSVIYMLVAWIGVATYQVLKYFDHDGSFGGLLDTAAFIVYSTTAQFAIGLLLIIDCGSRTNELQAHGFQHMLQIKQAEVISGSSNFLVEYDLWRSLHTHRNGVSAHVYVGETAAAYRTGELEMCEIMKEKQTLLREERGAQCTSSNESLPCQKSNPQTLREELNWLKPRALKKRARECGVDEQKLDEADDAVDVKGTIVTLIVDKALENSAAREVEAADLQKELLALKVRALKARAAKEGVDEAQINEADDASDVTTALIALIMEKAGFSASALPGEDSAQRWLRDNSIVEGRHVHKRPEALARTLHSLRCHHLLGTLIDTIRNESTPGARNHWAGEDRRAKLIFIHLDRGFVAGLWTSILSVLGPGVYALIKAITSDSGSMDAGSGIVLSDPRDANFGSC